MTDVVIPTWTLADHLRKARQVAGVNQKVFADLIGVKPSAYAQWEADNNRPRDVVSVAKRIEMLTRVPASWILGIDMPTAVPPPSPSNGVVSPLGTAQMTHRTGSALDALGHQSPETTKDAVAARSDDLGATASVVELGVRRASNGGDECVICVATDVRCPHQGSNLGPAD